MKIKHTLDEMQHCAITCKLHNAILHPTVDIILNEELHKLHHQGKICLMPHMHLKLHSKRFFRANEQ